MLCIHFIGNNGVQLSTYIVVQVWIMYHKWIHCYPLLCTVTHCSLILPDVSWGCLLLPGDADQAYCSLMSPDVDRACMSSNLMAKVHQVHWSSSQRQFAEAVRQNSWGSWEFVRVRAVLEKDQDSQGQFGRVREVRESWRLLCSSK